MKRARKILLYIFFTFITLLVVLVIVAALSENKIAKIAVEQVSKTMNIPIGMDDIHFSLIHNFPFATIRCENLKVSSPNSNVTFHKDTLVFLSELYVSVDVKPLLKGVFNVRKVEVSNGKLFYEVDTAGVSNIDFLNDTTQQNVVDTSANTIFLDIKDFTIENITCYYQDNKQKATANIFIENLNLSGLINNDEYKGEAEGNAILTNCSYDTTNVYLMNQADLDFKLTYSDGSLIVDKVDISIDSDARMELDGLVNFDDGLPAKLTVYVEKLDLAGLLKYVPENYFREYGISNLSGELSCEANVSGNLADSLMPSVETAFRLSEGNMQYQDYPALNNIFIEGKATNGSQKANATTSVDIDSMRFQTQNSKFNLSGKFENPDKLTYKLNSTIDLDLQEIEEYVPDSLVQSLAGKVIATISTNGILPDSITDAFIQLVLANTLADIKLENVSTNVDSLLSVSDINAEIKYQSDKVFVNQLKAGVRYDKYNLDSLNLVALITGNLINPDSLDIQMKKVNATLGKSNLALTGRLKYPFSPDYSVSGNIFIDLAEIQKFVPDSLVNNMSGNVSASFKSAAKLNLDSIGIQITKVFFEKSSFNAEFNQVNVGMPDSMMSFTNLFGSMQYNSDTLQIEQLEANYLGIQLGMNSVTAANVYSAVIENQPKELVVHGDFNAGNLDYALIENFLQEDSTVVPETEAEPMNFTYKINGRLNANSLKYGDALFTNVNSKFLVQEGHYVFDNLQLNAFDGSAVSSIKIEMLSNDEMDVYFKTNISKMDVAKIIKSFGQYIDYEDIAAENVQGKVSTKMDGKIVLKDFEPVYNSLLLNGDLTIENGALINVKPVMEVEKIPGIGLKNMDKLYFSTLNSSLFLFKNELYIPRTEIRSTSFDAMFLGMYSFGEDYEYHIRMFLGEVLSSKSKNNLKKQKQDGGFTEEDEKDVTKGRTSIYVVSKSIDGKEKAGFDNKHDRANMVAKINLQKNLVQFNFHPTLVNYDTEVK